MALISWLLTALAVVPSITLFVQGQSFPNPGCSKRKDPPHRLACGVAGTAQAGTLQQTANNAEQCNNLCLRRLGYVEPPTTINQPCYSSGYDNSSKVCTLYNNHVTDIGFEANNGSTSTYTDVNCFDCVHVCGPGPALNLFDDAGFELSATLYGPWYQSITDSDASPNGTVVEPGRNSARAFRFPPGNDMSIHQAFTGCDSALHYFSFAYQIICHNGCDPSMEISIGDYAAYAVPSWKSFHTNGTWATYTDYFYTVYISGVIVRFNQGLSVRFLNNNDTAPSSVEVFLDHFNATTIDISLTPHPSSAEMVQNGGFETGMLAPWQVTSNEGQITARVAEPGIDNTAYAYYVNGTSSSSATLEQNISGLVPGEQYILQFSYAVSHQTYISFVLQGQGTSSFEFLVCSPGYAFACTDRTLERPFFARETNVTLQLYLQLQDPKSGGIFHNQTAVIDSISLKRLR